MCAKSKSVPTASRKYKSTMFTRLFGEEDKLREILGALENKTYGPETRIKITTIDNVFSSGKLNDLSFEADGKLIVLIEHQSTLNDNMPLRMLFYITRQYNQRIKEENIYAQKRIPLPFPKFIILYNGSEEMADDVVELKLSDAFACWPGDEMPPLELTVKMYNINKGRNTELAKRSPTLDGYETFVAIVRENLKTMGQAKAIKRAMDACIKQDILKSFLKTYKKELVDMLVTEWDYDLEKKVLQKEAWEDGVAEGVKEGRAKGIKENALKTARAMRNDGMDVEAVARWTGLTVDDVLRL